MPREDFAAASETSARAPRRRVGPLTVERALDLAEAGPCLRVAMNQRAFSADCSALAAPIAVVTCCFSSGGGSTAFMPSDCDRCN